MNSRTFQTRDSSETGAPIGLLLRDLIDYAGLFPPTALPMAASVANYDAYLRSEWNWILGRFVVPVARLGEFEAALAGFPLPPSNASSATWRLSVLPGLDSLTEVFRIREFVARIGEFNDRFADSSSTRTRAAVIDAVEVRAANAGDVNRWSEIIPAKLAIYFEVALTNCAECIAGIGACGRRAKIRTGGETADKVPSSRSVTEFIRLCAAAHVPFKATAGLHHPLRSVHPFTYQPDSDSGIMHGFLNVFLAAAFLRAGMADDLTAQLLEESSADAFHFDLAGVTWRRHWLSWDEVAAARHDFALSFGSCSFTEPIDDLRALHLL